MGNKPTSTTNFEINPYDDNPPTKLNTYFKGPLRVVNFNSNVYTLQNLVTKKMMFIIFQISDNFYIILH